MIKKILLSGGVVLILAFAPKTEKIWQSEWLKIGTSGKLEYIPDEKGNILPDFSRVGYHHGDRQIPDVPVVSSISPQPKGKSDQVIQKAIDEVAKMPLNNNGFRGAILLKKGTYKISGSIKILSSGIVLRGEGDGENGTRLIATGTSQRPLIEVTGSGNLLEVPGTRVRVTDPYLAVGTKTLNVESASQYKVGDEVVLLRKGTANWINDIKMNAIVTRPGTLQWQPGDFDLHFERKITEIKGNTIVLDNPVMMQMEQKYGGASIYKSSFNGRIREVGIENILCESAYAHDTDEEHSWTSILFNKIENGWVRNITAKHFVYAGVSLNEAAKNITVRDSKCLDAKSVITGARRYSFNNNGQQNLFMNLETTEGRHDFVTGARTLGPNVFYNGKSTKTHADIGPHHRWAVGTLYDNIVTDGEINVQDRGNWGSGHGWAGVTQVLWNCTVKRAAIQSPWVSGTNYSIGTIGEKHKGRFAERPDGFWENPNKKGLHPQSLYMTQYQDRQNR